MGVARSLRKYVKNALHSRSGSSTMREITVRGLHVSGSSPSCLQSGGRNGSGNQEATSSPLSGSIPRISYMTTKAPRSPKSIAARAAVRSREMLHSDFKLTRRLAKPRRA
jgi:hypothetical protein